MYVSQCLFILSIHHLQSLAMVLEPSNTLHTGILLLYWWYSIWCSGFVCVCVCARLLICVFGNLFLSDNGLIEWMTTRSLSNLSFVQCCHWTSQIQIDWAALNHTDFLLPQKWSNLPLSSNDYYLYILRCILTTYGTVMGYIENKSWQSPLLSNIFHNKSEFI